MKGVKVTFRSNMDGNSSLADSNNTIEGARIEIYIFNLPDI